MSPDSYAFSKWAEMLITSNFNFIDYLDKNDFFTPAFFYLFPVTIIATCKLIFGETWQHVYMLINLISLIGIVYLFQLIAIKIKVRPLIISAILLLMLFSTDLHYWPSYILTDTINAFLVMINLFIAICNGFNKKPHSLSQVFFLLLLLCTRPSSPPMIILFILIPYLFLLPQHLLRTRVILSVAVFIITTITLSYSYLFTLYGSGKLQGGDSIQFIQYRINAGIIIDDRPETYIKTEATMSSIAELYILRLASFMKPYASGFSISHIISNCIITGTVTLAFFVWVYLTLSRQFSDMIDQDLNKVGLSILGFSLAIALFQSAIIIDYDWRYRFPVIVPLLLFSAIILEQACKVGLININKHIEPDK